MWEEANKIRWLLHNINQRSNRGIQQRTYGSVEKTHAAILAALLKSTQQQQLTLYYGVNTNS